MLIILIIYLNSLPNLYLKLIEKKIEGKSRSYELLSKRGFREDYEFPSPIKDINGNSTPMSINMMPFIFGDNETIPENFKRYIPLINICLENCASEYKKICYLTIDESYLEKGKSHRRCGLHTETIGIDVKSGYGTFYDFPPWWGGAYGGIFFGSNMDNSTAIYDAYVKDIEVIGPLGCIEHMRNTLNTKYSKIILKKNVLVWITDRTPHESLPVQEDGFRQFFRIVTSNVSFWYSKHSTPSPFGIKPPKETKIIDIDKFEYIKEYQNS